VKLTDIGWVRKIVLPSIRDHRVLPTTFFNILARFRRRFYIDAQG